MNLLVEVLLQLRDTLGEVRAVRPMTSRDLRDAAEVVLLYLCGVEVQQLLMASVRETKEEVLERNGKIINSFAVPDNAGRVHGAGEPPRPADKLLLLRRVDGVLAARALDRLLLF